MHNRVRCDQTGIQPCACSRLRIRWVCRWWSCHIRMVTVSRPRTIPSPAVWPSARPTSSSATAAAKTSLCQVYENAVGPITVLTRLLWAVLALYVGESQTSISCRRRTSATASSCRQRGSVDRRKYCQLSWPTTVLFVTLTDVFIELSWQHVATIDVPWRNFISPDFRTDVSQGSILNFVDTWISLQHIVR